MWMDCDDLGLPRLRHTAAFVVAVRTRAGTQVFADPSAATDAASGDRAVLGGRVIARCGAPYSDEE